MGLNFMLYLADNNYTFEKGKGDYILENMLKNDKQNLNFFIKHLQK